MIVARAKDRTVGPTSRPRSHSHADRRFRQHLSVVDEFAGESGTSLGPCHSELCLIRNGQEIKATASFEPPNVCLVAGIARMPSPEGDVRRVLDDFQATLSHGRFDVNGGTIKLRVAVPCKLKAPDAPATFRRLGREFVTALWNERLHAELVRQGAELRIRRHEPWT